MEIREPARAAAPVILRRLDAAIPKRVVVAIAFVLALAMFLAAGDRQFRGDAWEIWQVALHFDDPARERSFVEYRGPFVFALFHVLIRLSTAVGIDPVTGFYAFSALLFALLATVLLPFIAGRLVGHRPGAGHILIFAGVLYYFFGGYFLHPQVDVLALVFFLAAVSLILRATRSPRSAAMHAVAGGFFLCATLCRANYLVALPALLWIAAAPSIDARPLHRAMRASLLALPALLLVLTMFGRPDITPQDKVLRMQLTVGLKVQKIEWNAGDPRFPGGIEVPDSQGRTLLDSLVTPARPWLHPRDYARAVLEHPMTFAGIWARHAFNGMDLWYSSVYVKELVRGRILRSTLHYILVFIAFAVLWHRMRQAKAAQRGIMLAVVAAIAMPALSAVPFVIEVRFFLPLLAFLHALAVFGAGTLYRAPGKTGLLLATLIFAGTCLYASLHVSRSAGIELVAAGSSRDTA